MECQVQGTHVRLRMPMERSGSSPNINGSCFGPMEEREREKQQQQQQQQQQENGNNNDDDNKIARQEEGRPAPGTPAPQTHSDATTNSETLSDGEENQTRAHAFTLRQYRQETYGYDDDDDDLFAFDFETGSGRRRRKSREAPKKEAKKVKRGPQRPMLPGEVVWAKIPSYPWWPAQVQAPEEAHLQLRHNKKRDLFVVFFGDDNQCSWLPRDKLEPWMCEDFAERTTKRTKGLQNAVKAALEAIASAEPPAQEPEPQENGASPMSEDVPSPPPPAAMME